MNDDSEFWAEVAGLLEGDLKACGHTETDHDAVLGLAYDWAVEDFKRSGACPVGTRPGNFVDVYFMTALTDAQMSFRDARLAEQRARGEAARSAAFRRAGWEYR